MKMKAVLVFVEIYCQQEKPSKSEIGNGYHLLCIDCVSEVKWSEWKTYAIY